MTIPSRDEGYRLRGKELVDANARVATTTQITLASLTTRRSGDRLCHARRLHSLSGHHIDGEAIVCDKNGLAVFELIRGHRTVAGAVHCAFDLLEPDGEDLRRQPIEVRKGRLTKLLPALRAATRADPTFAEAWYNLGDLLDEQGRSETAIACLRTELGSRRITLMQCSILP
jgi:tetratricopeptide (TPR) repeat protein